MVILVSPVQPLNAYQPIEETELGIVALVSSVQPRNAPQPIEVTV